MPHPRGHLQATGRDDRGRKQYIYHSAWQIARNLEKFENLYEFGLALPRVRRVVTRRLARQSLDRQTLLAAIVYLLDRTLVRVGNQEYARQNDSFGLTTLRNRHARASGRSLRIRFRGKSGIEHDVRITHRRLVRIVRECQELPGQRLFQCYDDEGAIRPVTSNNVNDYLRSLTGKAFTAKEFRTWKATVHVLDYLIALCPEGEKASERQRKNCQRSHGRGGGGPGQHGHHLSQVLRSPQNSRTISRGRTGTAFGQVASRAGRSDASRGTATAHFKAVASSQNTILNLPPSRHWLCNALWKESLTWRIPPRT